MALLAVGVFQTFVARAIPRRRSREMSRLCGTRFLRVTARRRAETSNAAPLSIASLCVDETGVDTPERRLRGEGYVRRWSRSTPRTPPLCGFSDGTFAECHLTGLAVIATEKPRDQHGDETDASRRGRLGMLLGSLGLVVALCDAPNLGGTYRRIRTSCLRNIFELNSTRTDNRTIDG